MAQNYNMEGGGEKNKQCDVAYKYKPTCLQKNLNL
jgi:hypothetical protein